jgi:hypothetical protein
MTRNELRDAIDRWLCKQGYTTENCRTATFISWYCENYPQGDKSLPEAFYNGDWRYMLLEGGRA